MAQRQYKADFRFNTVSDDGTYANEQVSVAGSYDLFIAVADAVLDHVDAVENPVGDDEDDSE